jgi:hypothetical protein
VKIKVEPGNVVTTVGPGTMVVDVIRLVTVLAGSCVVIVEVTAGIVVVTNTVDAGSCVVIVDVMTMVLAGWTLTVVIVTGGSTEVDVIVCVTVCGGS